MRRKLYSQAVIVIGLDLNGLTVCRALGKMGISIIGICDKEKQIASFSRYVDIIHYIEDYEQDLICFLLSDKLKNSGKPLLFPTTDQTVGLLANNFSLLKDRFTIGFNAPDTILSLLDKNIFRGMARKFDLKIAEGRVFFKGDRIESDFLDNCPLIIKTCKKVYSNDPNFNLPKAVVVQNKNEAVEWIEIYLEHAGECLVEEYIVGEDNDVFFVFVFFDCEGKSRFEYCGRKIRQWPIGTGGTASAMPWQDVELTAKTIKFFKDVNFSGLGSLEFKLDKDRNEFFAIEPTVGRIDFQEGLAIGNGLNFPYFLYADMFNLELFSNVELKTNNKNWFCFDADLNAISKICPGFNWVKIRWLFGFFRPRIYSVFNFKDLSPFVFWFKDRFFNKG